MNKKVYHDVTDKDHPNFDVFQDIQSQNNFSTTQLNIMGYKGDALKSQFMEKTILGEAGRHNCHGTPDLQAPRGYCCRKYKLVTSDKHVQRGRYQ